MTRLILISVDGLAAFYWRDPLVRAPTLRRLAERGAVATGMETVFPSTTWPTHVSLVTGVSPVRHGVVGNHILNRQTGRPEDLTGDPIYDAADLLRAPTIWDRAHARGLTVAAVDWPATRNARALDWSLPFFKDQAIFESQTPRAVWAELGSLGYPLHRQGEWAQLPRRFLKDAMVADVAAHLIHRRAPDLLLLHFLCADSHQHLHGPRSPEAYWAIEYIDGLIGRVLDALASPAREATAVVVVSDHGFLPSEHEIRPNVRLRQLGALRVDGEGRITDADARFVMNHGAGYLYVDPRRARTGDVLAALAGMEGVAGAWEASRFAEVGLPGPGEHPHVGDAILEATPGYCFGDDAAGADELGPPKYRGTHGQRGAHRDNHAFFLAAGAGIRRGVELGTISSRDVAPTLAHLLDVKMDDVEGRPLAQILD